jgi:hypothetical protein
MKARPYVGHEGKRKERAGGNAKKKKKKKKKRKNDEIFLGFARGSPRSVLLAFSQSYVEHDLRKNKIGVSFFC